MLINIIWIQNSADRSPIIARAHAARLQRIAKRGRKRVGDRNRRDKEVK
jgi:hypothetical protein